jgi:hypothetical protein
MTRLMSPQTHALPVSTALETITGLPMHSMVWFLQHAFFTAVQVLDRQPQQLGRFLVFLLVKSAQVPNYQSEGQPT